MQKKGGKLGHGEVEKKQKVKYGVRSNEQSLLENISKILTDCDYEYNWHPWKLFLFMGIYK